MTYIQLYAVADTAVTLMDHVIVLFVLNINFFLIHIALEQTTKPIRLILHIRTAHCM